MKHLTRLLLCLAFAFSFGAWGVSASETVGSIGPSNARAWSENVGWIDFGSTAGAVTFTDSGLSGYAYGENVGWISLHCSNTSSCGAVDFGVLNTGSGDLSGYAWGENVGWIDFSGVSIGSNGAFSGYAYGENVGWISLHCSNTSSCGTVDFGVVTDWRPVSARQEIVTTRSSSSSSARRASVLSTATPLTQPQNIVIPNAGGDGSLVSQLISLFARLYPEFAASLSVALSNQGSVPVTAPSEGLSSCPDMYIGITGSCVRLLQVFLNARGFAVSIDGAGSPGLETETFGPATRAALVAFQKANGIEPSLGYFGSRTKSMVRALGE